MDGSRGPQAGSTRTLFSIAGASVFNPAIAPDGTRVAYTVTETDLDQDAYITQIWLLDVASGESIQLTRG